MGKHLGSVPSSPARETRCVLFASHLVSFNVKLFPSIHGARVVTIIKETGVGGDNSCKIHRETSVVIR